MKNQSTEPWIALIGLLALALLVRGGVLVSMPESLTDDPDAYRHYAENLVEHGVFGHGSVPSAYRPPLYSLLLTGPVALGDNARLAIGLLHLAMGVATVWLVYRLGRRWGLGAWSLAAAALVACDPILLVQSTLVMTETLATLLAVVSLWGLSRFSRSENVTVPFGIPRAGDCPDFRVAKMGLSPSVAYAFAWTMAAGGLLALASLCRPTFLVFTAVAGLLVATLWATWATRLKTFAAFSAAVALVLAPWVVRNQIQFGRPIVATTHGGYTLLLGNNPSFYDYLRSGAWATVWDEGDYFDGRSKSMPRDELRRDRIAYAEARQNIRRQPGMFAYACVVRVGRLWAPLPHRLTDGESPARRSVRYTIGLWYLAEFLLAAIGLFAVFTGRPRAAGLDPALCRPNQKRRTNPWLWGVLLVVCFTAVHTLYWTNMRMRAPLMPVVALAAAAGAGAIATWAARALGFRKLL